MPRRGKHLYETLIKLWMPILQTNITDLFLFTRILWYFLFRVDLKTKSLLQHFHIERDTFDTKCKDNVELINEQYQNGKPYRGRSTDITVIDDIL